MLYSQAAVVWEDPVLQEQVLSPGGKSGQGKKGEKTHGSITDGQPAGPHNPSRNTVLVNVLQVV